jgi:hypothetical protein
MNNIPRNTVLIQASPDRKGVRLQRHIDGAMLEFVRKKPFSTDEVARIATLAEIEKWANGDIMFSADNLNRELRSAGLSDTLGDFQGHYAQEVTVSDVKIDDLQDKR